MQLATSGLVNLHARIGSLSLIFNEFNVSMSGNLLVLVPYHVFRMFEAIGLQILL